MQLEAGDRVEHRAFGAGTVRSVQPMAGDVLAEVDFGGAGVKKLMLKYAQAHMKKLERTEKQEGTETPEEAEQPKGADA